MSQDPAPSVESASSSQDDDLWRRMMEDVRVRFPAASVGVGFCILKLEQNPDLRLRDFKAEAELHGIGLSGRSFHSARVALGYEQPSMRRTKTVEAEPTPSSAAVPSDKPAAARWSPGPSRSPAMSDDESPVIAALRQFEAKNADDVERLRAAIREVLHVIDGALEP